MRRLALALALLPLAALSACGANAHHGAGAADPASSATAGLLGDQDRDASPTVSYEDSDDRETHAYGRPATAAQAAALTALVRSYYAAAAADEPARACSLTYYARAEELSEEYDGPPGPHWLSGVKTCADVLGRVFAHYRAELRAPVFVTSVRVYGNHAQVLVGFKTVPAGFLMAHREAAGWKVDSMLARPLP
jgi:hypothetical protein